MKIDEYDVQREREREREREKIMDRAHLIEETAVVCVETVRATV
jgi:hypothetical protein